VLIASERVSQSTLDDWVDYRRKAALPKKNRREIDMPKSVLTLAAAWAQFDAMVFDGSVINTPKSRGLTIECVATAQLHSSFSLQGRGQKKTASCADNYNESPTPALIWINRAIAWTMVHYGGHGKAPAKAAATRPGAPKCRSSGCSLRNRVATSAT
jgi:hypothetical protein